DKLIYFRQDGEGLVLGGYEREPLPFDLAAIADGNNPTVTNFDRSRFDGLLRAGIERVPCLRGAALEKEVNGIESFTPDGEFILGETPNVHGFWAACGFCAHG